MTSNTTDGLYHCQVCGGLWHTEVRCFYVAEIEFFEDGRIKRLVKRT